MYSREWKESVIRQVHATFKECDERGTCYLWVIKKKDQTLEQHYDEVDKITQLIINELHEDYEWDENFYSDIVDGDHVISKVSFNRNFNKELSKKEVKVFDNALNKLHEALSFLMIEPPTDYQILEPLVGAKKANEITDLLVKLEQEKGGA